MSVVRDHWAQAQHADFASQSHTTVEPGPGPRMPALGILFYMHAHSCINIATCGGPGPLTEGNCKMHTLGGARREEGESGESPDQQTQTLLLHN